MVQEPDPLTVIELRFRTNDALQRHLQTGIDQVIEQ